VQHKTWRSVARSFNVPATATAASHNFRVYYEKYLLDYENACARPPRPPPPRGTPL